MRIQGIDRNPLNRERFDATLIAKWSTMILVVVSFTYLDTYIWRLHHGDLRDLAALSEGVLNGTPHWRAFQSRLLGPYAISIISIVSSYPLLRFLKLTVFMANALLGWLLMNADQRMRKSLFGFMISFVIWTVGMHYWSCPWDWVEMITLLCFCALCFEEGGLAAYAALALVSMLNRESAVYIALFVILSGLTRSGVEKLRWLLGGSATLLLIVIYTKAARDVLFKRSSLPGVGLDLGHQALGNHSQFVANREFVVAAVTRFLHLELLALYLSLLAIHGFVGWRALRVRKNQVSLYCLVIVLYLMSLCVFGKLDEGRIYQVFSFSTAYLIVRWWGNRSEKEIAAHREQARCQTAS